MMLFHFDFIIVESWNNNWVGPPDCKLECEHDTGKKWWLLKKLVIFKKKIFNYKIFFCSLLIYGICSWIFCIAFSVPSITYVWAIKISWADFAEIWFFDFFKFLHNFCTFFFELIIGINSFCLPSQYGIKFERQIRLKVEYITF